MKRILFLLYSLIIVLFSLKSVHGLVFGRQAIPVEDIPNIVFAARDGSIWTTLSAAGILLKHDLSGKEQRRLRLDGFPEYMAETSLGEIVVTLKQAATVAVVSPAGDVKTKFSVKFNASYVVVDKDDQIWVSFTAQNIVARYAKDGTPLDDAFINNRIGPFGMAIDGFNNVWIACQNSNMIVKIDSVGSFLDEYPSGGIAPAIIITDLAGGFWISHSRVNSDGSHRMVHFSETGRVIGGFGVFHGELSEFQIDADRNFWFPDGLDMLKYSEAGFLQEIYPIKEGDIKSVAVDRKGNIWVTSKSTFLVRFRPFETTFSRDISGYSFLKSDFEGNIWVLSATNQQLIKLDENGAELFRLPISLPIDIQSNPSSLVDDRRGHIWISRVTNGAGFVSKITYKGEVLGHFPVGANPKHLAADSAGNIYVDCSHGVNKAIFKLKNSGELFERTVSVNFERDVIAMSVDPSNNLIVLTSDGALLTISSDFIDVRDNSLDSSLYPMSMILDKSGNAWVLSRVNDTHIFAASFIPRTAQRLVGEILIEAGFQDSRGIFVLDNNNHLLLDRFNFIHELEDGALLGLFSTHGSGTLLGLILDSKDSLWMTTINPDQVIKVSSVLEQAQTATRSPTNTPSEVDSVPVPIDDSPGLRTFLGLFIVTLFGAFLLFLKEYQRIREARMFLAAIRVRDRLLFRLKTGQSRANPNNAEIPISISSLFLLLLDAKAQYDVRSREVHLRAHEDHVELERAVLAAHLALFSLVFSYRLSDRTSNNNTDKVRNALSTTNQVTASSAQSMPIERAAAAADYVTITDAAVAEPRSDALNFEEATNHISSALSKLSEGTKVSYDKAKLRQAELDAFTSLQYLHKFSLDPSLSTMEILNEALANKKSPWRKDGKKFQKAIKQCIGLLPRFVNSQEGRTKQQMLRARFPRFAQFPIFYGVFHIFIVTIFLSFAAKVDRTNASMDANNRVPPGLTVGNLPFLLGGYGQTFLPIPPQYNLTDRPAQASGVPVLYGVMHCVLFFLGMLPIPFMRGFWRDAVHTYPMLRHYMPIDDFTFFHRLCAWLALSGLLLGCFIWLATLGMECGFRDQLQACLGFDTSKSSPVDNVLILRLIVWVLWFPLMPLMYFARRGPWKWLPNPIKRFYFEIIYYLHVLIALITVLLALICRFTVFYPVLISWIPYFLDWFREVWFHTHKVTVNENQVKWFSSIHDNKPTSVRLSFKHGVSNNSFGAGQWTYLMIPAIDYNWHPFSIASASKDREIELHIGVIAPGIEKHSQTRSWVMPKGTETWTYNLWQLIRTPQSDNNGFNAYIRGPYGTAFSSCFDSNYNACVVIGAGTGLTAAESVLREIVQMRKSKLPTPNYTWFVWSCRRVDDIMWCWDTLVDLIYDCCKEGVLDIELISSGQSDALNVFDWLGVAIFATQATEKELKEFVSFRTNLRTVEHQEIEEWLFNQIVAGALDDEDTHVRKLLQGVHNKLVVSGTRKPRMTVSFCGPSTLATTISSATQQLGGTIEFSSDNQ